jgi:hypothetical protein
MYFLLLVHARGGYVWLLVRSVLLLVIFAGPIQEACYLIYFYEYFF